MTTLKDFQFVYIGCGGTLYAASSYLAVLENRFSIPDGRASILIDPDVIEDSDSDRQWPEFEAGMSKVRAAGTILGAEDEDSFIECVNAFSSSDQLLLEKTEGQPVLAIVNVDNDECRLAVADWLAGRTSTGIMVVSGCERNLGQCYPGVWMNGEPVYDWRELHSDVGEDRPPTNRCNLQNIRANALTGVLVGMCIEDIAGRVEANDWNFIKRFYWRIERDNNGQPNLRMWDEATMPVLREGVEVE